MSSIDIRKIFKFNKEKTFLIKKKKSAVEGISFLSYSVRRRP